MTLGDGAVRVPLVEYAPPKPVLSTLSTALGLGQPVLRDQIVSAGQRLERALLLPRNPISVATSGVAVADVAGLVRVGPRLEFEIAPKFLGSAWARWREDFFFISMLSRHGRLLGNERIRSAVGARGDLATLVARAVITMFWDNHRRPLRTYRHADALEFVIDGEVDPESIVLPELDGYAQRLVTYDRRNCFNAVILAASQALLAEVRDPHTRRQLSRVVEALAPQGTVRRPRHRRVPTRARRWQPLHDLAIDVLQGFGVAYEAGSARAPGYVLETWRAWEDLLTVACRLVWGGSSVGVQRSLSLGVRFLEDRGVVTGHRAVLVTPDLVLRGRGQLIIDAKYKGRFGDLRNRVSEADLYEALAFASAAKQPQIVLLYPAIAMGGPAAPTGTTVVFERVAVGDVVVLGMEVEVRGISQVGGLRQFAAGLADGVLAATADPSRCSVAQS